MTWPSWFQLVSVVTYSLNALYFAVGFTCGAVEGTALDRRGTASLPLVLASPGLCLCKTPLEIRSCIGKCIDILTIHPAHFAAAANVAAAIASYAKSKPVFLQWACPLTTWAFFTVHARRWRRARGEGNAVPMRITHLLPCSVLIYKLLLLLSSSRCSNVDQSAALHSQILDIIQLSPALGRDRKMPAEAKTGTIGSATRKGLNGSISQETDWSLRRSKWFWSVVVLHLRWTALQDSPPLPEQRQMLQTHAKLQVHFFESASRPFKSYTAFAWYRPQQWLWQSHAACETHQTLSFIAPSLQIGVMYAAIEGHDRNCESKQWSKISQCWATPRARDCNCNFSWPYSRTGKGKQSWARLNNCLLQIVHDMGESRS